MSKVQFPILMGILPVNILLYESITSSERWGWHKSTGRLPDKLLLATTIDFKEEMLKIESGNSPANSEY